MSDFNSTWIDTSSLPRFPRPAGKVQADVVVVGGGITGLTAAYLLKKTGHTVAVIERGRCARIDTGRTTAHLTCVTDKRLHHLVKVFGAERARAVWDAGGAAIDQIVSLVRAEEIACDFNWVSGFLHAAPGHREEKFSRELQKEEQSARSLGIRAEYLAAIPFFGVPGVHFPHQALFHPLKYLSALARAIPGKGSHIFENTSAEEFKEKPLTVKAGGQSIQGGYLILATHNPMMGNAGTAASLLLQTKLFLYTSYALGARVPAGLIPSASFWDTGDPYGYLRVDRRRGHDYAIYGGEDHKTGQEADITAVYARLEQKFLSLAPTAAIDHRWSGQVIETSDGLPLIGETAERQFVATGFSGNGMTFGTLGAMMAADAVLGRKNPWQKLLDVHRKKLVGSTWNYLKENKDYPYYLVRNWLASAEGKSFRSLRKGRGRILNLEGRKVAAYLSEQGQLSLCSPICTHLQCIVAWNNAERTWDCPCHGSRFKPTGEVISGPAEEPLEKLSPPKR